MWLRPATLLDQILPKDAADLAEQGLGSAQITR
jgi:hypothetical protein